MEVTVKTLDGRNQSFNITEEMTVQQFKEKIEETLTIPIAQQRLIFQGKVLQDEKKMSEYNVTGKVVHLVPRPPPSATSGSNSQSSGGHRTVVNEGVEAQTQMIDLPDVGTIQDMVQNILSGMGEFGRSASVATRSDGAGLDIHVNIPQAFHRMSLARIRQQYVGRMEAQVQALLRHLGSPDTVPLPAPDIEVLQQDSPFATTGADAERPANTEGSQTDTGDGTASGTNPLPIPSLADMMDRVRDLWRLAEPFIDRWQTMLREDQTMSSERAREAQQFYETVNRLVHLLSHMMHNISDFIVEFDGGQTPRHLLVLSEVPVQTIQARINIGSRGPSDGPMPGGRPGSRSSRNASLTRLQRMARGAAPTDASSTGSTSEDPRTRSASQPRADDGTTAPPNTASLPNAAGLANSTRSANRSTVSESSTHAESEPRGRTSVLVGLSDAPSTVTQGSIQGPDGSIYLTASSEPRTYFEVHRNAFSVNSVSTHIIASGFEDHSTNSGTTDEESNRNSSTATQSANTGTTNTTTETAISGSTENTGGAGSNTTTSGSGASTAPSVGGMPRDVLQQVLESALRQSLNVTGLGVQSPTPSPQQQSVRVTAASGGTGGLTGIVIRPQQNLHAMPQPSPMHQQFPVPVVDPYLPCHSRHYIDHDHQTTSMETDSGADSGPFRVNLGGSARGAQEGGQGRQGANGRGTRRAGTPASGPHQNVMGQVGPIIGVYTGRPGGTMPRAQILGDSLNAMSSVLSAMFGAGLQPPPAFARSSTASSGRTGTATTNTATTPNAGAGAGGGESTATSNSTGGASGDMASSLQNIISAMWSAFLQPNQASNQQVLLGDFLRETTGNSGIDENPDSLLVDMSNILLTEWQVSDLVAVTFYQDRRPIDRLREPMQRQVARREAEAGSREALVNSILEMCREMEGGHLDTLDFGEVDPWGSISNLYRYHLTHILDLIVNSPTDTGFGGLLMASLNHLVEDWLALMELMCREDEELLQTYFNQTFTAWTSGLMAASSSTSTDTDTQNRPGGAATGEESGQNPTMLLVYNWFNTLLRSRRQQMTAERRERLRTTVSGYLVNKKPPGVPADTCVNGSEPLSMVTDDLDDGEFTTPPEHNSPTTTLFSDVLFENAASVELPTDPLVPHPDALYLLQGSSGEGSSSDPEAMDTGSPSGSTGEDSAAGWQAVLPQEWVHVVQRDFDLQKKTASKSPSTASTTTNAGSVEHNKPLSDAYLAGMPAKRRRLMLAAKEVITQPVDRFLSECVHQATRQSGVTSPGLDPRAPSQMAASLAAEPALSSAFREFVVEKVNERLTTDTDYSSHLFPSTERVFRSSSSKKEHSSNSGPNK